MNSFLDSETLRGREREEEGGEGEGEGDQKQAPPFKVPGPREGQGFRIRPLFSAGAKGAESGGNLRSYRRPFHSDCDLLRRVDPVCINQNDIEERSQHILLMGTSIKKPR
jgi:hypothetical protein